MDTTKTVLGWIEIGPREAPTRFSGVFLVVPALTFAGQCVFVPTGDNASECWLKDGDVCLRYERDDGEKLAPFVMVHHRKTLTVDLAHVIAMLNRPTP